MGLLDRLWADIGRVQVEILAVIFDRVRAPYGEQALDRFFADPAALAVGNVRRVALVLRPGEPDADCNTAVTQHVHRSQPLREQNRVVPRDVDHTHTESDALSESRHKCHTGQMVEMILVLLVKNAFGVPRVGRLRLNGD